MRSNIFMNFILGTLTLLVGTTSLASDLYEGQLILTGSNKAGVLVTGSKNIEGRILLTRNKKSLLQIPISINEVSFGLSAGIKFSGDSFIHYKISGLNENTKISDLFETFTGTNAGATFAVPGPCCITLNKEVMSIENAKGIQISGEGQSTGWMLELAKAIVKIKPLNKYSERKTLTDKSLAEIPESEYQSPQGSTLMSLECKDSTKSTTYFLAMNGFNEITLKTYASNPLKSFFSKSSNSLKPTVINNILNLYPEKVDGQIIGSRFDIDLNSEVNSDQKDFFGRSLYYSAKKIDADSVTTLTCLSKTSLKNSLVDIEKYYSSIWR